MKKIFYEKVGRRYVPVSEYDQELMDSFGHGDHLISVYPGGSSRRYRINPNYAALIAAGRVACESMHDAIRKAVEMKNSYEGNRPLTKEQLKAWHHFVDVMGTSGHYIHYNSVHDIAEAGLQALEKEAARLMTHPAVQDAYNQFLTVCQIVDQKS